MEVNNLTYKIYSFLKKKGWNHNRRHDSKYIYLIPERNLGFPDEFELKLAISNKSKDFYSFTKRIIDLLEEVYPNNLNDIRKIIELNEKLKHRFTSQWIIPEEKSRIAKISKYDIYIPK